MTITPDKFNEINQEYLESLIKNRIEESLHLDYKEKVDNNNAEIAELNSLRMHWKIKFILLMGIIITYRLFCFKFLANSFHLNLTILFLFLI